MRDAAHQQLMQNMQAEIDGFDRAYQQNVANGLTNGLRVVPDHTKPGQFRVQRHTAMMSGEPQWKKVFTGSRSECDRFVSQN